MHRWLTAVLLLLGMLPAMADTLPPATGPVLLTVTGEIATTNAEGRAEFDQQMLEDLGSVTFETSTIWTEGPQVFTGVSLHRLMQVLGGGEGQLLATAINDYSVEIPGSDIVEGGPMIAFLLNGKPMSLREKGPLWVVYPYDHNAEYQSETTYSRSIWQLDRLEVVR